MAELIELGSILHMEKGKKPKEQVQTPTDGYLPYVDIKAFEEGIINSYATTENCLTCEDGDLLIVCDGSRSGLTGIAIKGVVGSTLSKIYADGMTTKYLQYYIQSKYILLNTRKKGTGTPHLNAEILKKSKLIVPPIAEQERIVAKIEELFSQSDKAIQTLQTVKQQLSIYRQSVLKSAFEGDYLSTQFKNVIINLQNGIAKRKGTEGKNVIVLRLANISDNSILYESEMRKILLTDTEQTRYMLSAGDALIVRVNGSVDRVGRMVIIDKSNTYAYCDHLIRCIFDKSKVLPQYIKYFFDKYESRQYIKDNIVSTAGQNTISQTTLENLQIKIPPIEKQQQIISEIESRLSVCDSIEKTVDDALLQAEALRQSILKQAFEGELI